MQELTRCVPPFPAQAKFGGEDAFFTCWSKDGRRLAFGVADGVGGSRSDDDPEALVAGELCIQMPMSGGTVQPIIPADFLS